MRARRPPPALALPTALAFACARGPVQLADSDGDTDTSSDTSEPSLCSVEITEKPSFGADDWSLVEQPTGGDVIVFYSSDSQPERIYAATGQNGIFRSEDGGETWSDSLAAIAHAYGQTDVSETNADCIAYTAGKGWASGDGGETWTPIVLNDEESNTVQGLGWMGDTLMVVTASGETFLGEDCGQSGFVYTGKIDSAFRGGGHGQLSASWWVEDQGDNWFVMGDQGELFWSSNGGETWDKLLFEALMKNVTYRANEEGHWVVAQGDDTFEVWWTPDFSPSTTIVDTIKGTASNAFLTAEGEYLVSFDGGIWSSTDGIIEIDYDDEDRGFYAVGKTPLGHVAGLRAGVIHSGDDGATWAFTSEEMLDWDIVNAEIHPYCPNVLLAGTQCRSGGYRSLDWGQTWERIDSDMHYTMGFDFSPAAPDEIWGVTDDLLVFSDDMGETWSQRYPKGQDADGAHFHGLAVSPTRAATVLVGSVGSGELADDQARVYRTDNHGASWSESMEGLPFSDQSFHVFHWSRTEPATVLLGTYRAGEGLSHGASGSGIGMFRSTDGGHVWSRVEMDALNIAHFAECDGTIYAATDDGVLASGDAGLTWTRLLDASEGGEINNVACAGERMLAVDITAEAIYRSEDAGQTWEDWTGFVTFELREVEVQMGLELSDDGTRAWYTQPRLGIVARDWE